MGLKIRNKITDQAIREKIDILKKVVIFSETNQDILKRIALSLDDVYVEEGQEVFHKGDRLNAMYIIVNGSVKVHDDNHIFTEFAENDFFGEYSLIDSSVRSATVTAKQKTHLLRLNQKEFLATMEQDIEVSKAILKALIKRLRNNNILEERLTQNSIKIQKQRDELDEQKRKLEELNATKDKFFTIIAHDLKNPFNTVIGLTELLKERFDTYETSKVKEFIDQIFIFSNNIYHLLEDLLEWAKVQTGKLKVNREKTDIFELVNETYNLYREKARNKNIKLISTVDIGTYAFIDKYMVNTVIRNLVSNAIKFTYNGGEVCINTYTKGDFIHVSVKDNGVGIAKNDLENVFSIGSNYSTPGTDQESGTGLGLIICKEFIEKNGGVIQVQSEINKGAEFVFSLPVFKN